MYDEKDYQTTITDGATGKTMTTSQLLGKVYAIVAYGIILTFATSLLCLHVLPTAIYTNVAVAIGVGILLIFTACSSLFINLTKGETAGFITFSLYSIGQGFLMTVIFLQYSFMTIAMTLVITSFIFIIAAAIGCCTKKDLTKWHTWLIPALFTICIALIIGVFIQATIYQIAVSVCTIPIFIILTVVDSNEIIQKKYIADECPAWAYSFAIQLYLDFLNLFLHLLRILGLPNVKK